MISYDYCLDQDMVLGDCLRMDMFDMVWYFRIFWQTLINLNTNNFWTDLVGLYQGDEIYPNIDNYDTYNIVFYTVQSIINKDWYCHPAMVLYTSITHCFPVINKAKAG